MVPRAVAAPAAQKGGLTTSVVHHILAIMYRTRSAETRTVTRAARNY